MIFFFSDLAFRLLHSSGAISQLREGLLDRCQVWRSQGKADVWLFEETSVPSSVRLMDDNKYHQCSSALLLCPLRSAEKPGRAPGKGSICKHPLGAIRWDNRVLSKPLVF